MKTKVIVIHAHEKGEGSRIVAVCRATPSGTKIAERIKFAEETRPNVGADEVTLEEIEITEFTQPSKPDLEVLRAIHAGTPLRLDHLRLLPRLIEKGYLVKSAEGKGIRIIITPIGEAAIAHDGEQP